MIHLLSLGEEMDDVDFGRWLDFLVEDLARLGVVSGVASDPAPLHGWAERGAHDGVDPTDTGGGEGRAVPARLGVARCPGRAGAVVRARRTLAFLASASWAVLGTRCSRAGTVGACAAASASSA